MKFAKITLYSIFLFAFYTLEGVNTSQQVSSFSIKANQIFSLDCNPSSISSASTTKGDFDQGYIEWKKVLKLTLSSNSAFKLTVHSQDSTLNSNGKPISDLLWKRPNKVNYIALSDSTPELILSKKKAVSSIKRRLNLKMLLDWVDDTPGDFEATLIFTLGPNV